jgi:hypothetical protein
MRCRANQSIPVDRAVRLECRAGVAGQETGDCVPHALADRVSLNQDELTDDFTGMNGRGIHDGSPWNVGGDSTCAPTDGTVKVS